MTIEALCPNCSAVYNVREEMAGKSVRCKKCENTFTIKKNGKPAKGNSSVQAKGAGAKPPTKPPAAAGGRSAVRRPPPVEDEEAEEEEEAPRRGRPQKKLAGGDGSKKLLIILGAVALVLLLTCGTGAFFIYRAIWGATNTANKMLDDVTKQMQEDMKRQGLNPGQAPTPEQIKKMEEAARKALEEMPKGGFPFPDKKQGEPKQPEEKKDEKPVVVQQPPPEEKVVQQPPPKFEIPAFPPGNKRPSNVNEAIEDLQGNDANKQRSALSWLARQPVDAARQGDVAKAVDPFVAGPDQGMRGWAINALKVWATRDNVFSLAKFLDDSQVGDVANVGIQQNVIALLGNLRDEHGAAAVLRFMPHLFTGDSALKALQTMGPVAKKETLKHYWDSDGGMQTNVRRLLQQWNTTLPEVFQQALEELKSTDAGRRGAVAGWLAQQSADPSVQLDIARALNTTVGDSDNSVSEAGINALKKWAVADVNVPTLLPLLSLPPGDAHNDKMRQGAIEVLGLLRDPRAVVQVAQRLTVGVDRQVAAKALRLMGAAAQQELTDKYLGHPDAAVRNEAANILKSMGATGNLGLTQAILDVKSTDSRRRQDGARLLAKGPADDKQRADVVKALVACLDDQDRSTAVQAMKALGTWAVKDDSDIFVKALGNQAPQIRQAALEDLGKLKDEKTVGAVLSRLTDPGDRKAASNALKAMGSMVERPVLTGLNSTDKGVRLECLAILEAVGTQAGSLQTLNAFLKFASSPLNPPRDRNPRDRDGAFAAQRAIAAIQSRP